MGSWDETCGLTGLPIRVGDPVYLQIIAENWCPSIPPDGSYGFYRPILFPIKGKYGDYGRICEIEDNLAFHLLNKISKEVFQLDSIDFLDKEIIGNVFPFEALDKEYKLQMGHVFFHENAYQMFSGIMDKFQVKSWKKAIQDLHRWAKYTDDTNSLIYDGKKKRDKDWEIDFCGQEANLWLRRRYGFHIIVKHLYYNPNDFDLLKLYCEFDIAFNRLRKLYIPLTGCQNWSYDIHREVSKWVVDHVNEIEKQFVEDGDLLSDY